MKDTITFRYEVRTVTNVTYYKLKGRIHTDILFDGLGCVFAKHIKAKAGDSAELYTDGSVTMALAINGKGVYFKSKKQQEEEDRRWKENYKKEKQQKFRKQHKQYDADFAALPEVFQKRIQWFRDHGGVSWRGDWEGYELAACKEAVHIAQQYPTAKQLQNFFHADRMSPKITGYTPLSDEHSGNTWGFSKHLAWWFVTHPENVFLEHGVGTPLVGCADYGCMHPRSIEKKGWKKVRG